MRIKFILLFFLFFAFNFCSSYYTITEDDSIRINKAVDKILITMNLESEFEYDLFYNGMESFITYTVEQKGNEILSGIESCDTVEEIRDILTSFFNKTPKKVSVEALRYWESKSNYDYESNADKFMEFETEHYIIQTFEDTKAYEDLEKIAYLSEKYIEEVMGFIEPDEETINNFYQNLSRLERQKIIIILPPDIKYWNKNMKSLAFMSFGMDYGTDGLKYYISIGIPYYNSLSSATLTHEITHMVDLLFKIQIPSKLENQEAEKEDFENFFNHVMTDIFPHDSPWGEGFAEYVSNEYSIFHNKGLIYSPHDRIKSMIERMGLINNILTTPINRIIYNHILQYTELQSMVRFLIDVYGKNKFIDFYFSVPLSEDKFKEVYGKNYDEIEEEWKTYYDFYPPESKKADNDK